MLPSVVYPANTNEPEVQMIVDYLNLLFACGGDGDDDKEPPRIDPPKPKAPAKRPTPKRSDPDDEDYDYIEDPKDRKIKKLSDECARRRNHENELEGQLELKDEEIQGLTQTVNNAVKLQTKYDKLRGEFDGLQSKSKEQAIRTALSTDKIVDEKGKETPRAWYDVDMVLSLLDRESIAVDLTDGSVGGLSEQLNQLAEQKPFLVKAASGDQGNSANNRPTGSAPQTSAGGTRNQEVQRSEREMVDMFPALRNVTK